MMKSIFTLSSLMLMTLAVSAQQKLELTAAIPSLPNDTVVRLWNAIDKTTDSTYVKNHSFSFSKSMSEGGSIFVLQVGNRAPEITGLGALVYLDGGKMNISGGTNLNDASYSGSPFVKEWVEMNKVMDAAVADIKDGADLSVKLSEAKAVGDADAIAALEAERNKYHSKLLSSGKKWIAEHPNSGVSAYVLNALLAEAVSSREERLAIIDKFGPRAKHNQITRMMLAGMTGVAESFSGKLAPAFTQPDVNGKKVSLADFKGKYVLVDFWASWCTPCRAESPYLKAAYQKFKDKGFTIISLSLDDDREKWLKAIAEDQLPWVHVSDLKAAKNQVAIDYKELGIPANFLIDPTGKIIGSGYREGMLDARLTELLK
jgi:thiol-disulfide isomerase/thioredoxin